MPWPRAKVSRRQALLAGNPSSGVARYRSLMETPHSAEDGTLTPRARLRALQGPKDQKTGSAGEQNLGSAEPLAGSEPSHRLPGNLGPKKTIQHFLRKVYFVHFSRFALLLIHSLSSANGSAVFFQDRKTEEFPTGRTTTQSRRSGKAASSEASAEAERCGKVSGRSLTFVAAPLSTLPPTPYQIRIPGACHWPSRSAASALRLNRQEGSGAWVLEAKQAPVHGSQLCTSGHVTVLSFHFFPRYFSVGVCEVK